MELVEIGGGGPNRRFLVRLDDGAAVEAVLYHGSSLCVSSQVGCALGCPFCASGSRGLSRALRREELEGQVLGLVERGYEIARVTLSGVGEPLHNPHSEAFLGWCRERGIAPSVTTSGSPLARLRSMIHAPHNGLTVSVHAGREATRARVVPRGPALAPLFSLLAEELPRLSRSRRRKVALAYLLVEGLNDGDAELDAFAARAERLPCRVHLYALNPVPSAPHRPVSPGRYEAAWRRLRARGLRVQRSSRARLEPDGGCGTLVARAAPR